MLPNNPVAQITSLPLENIQKIFKRMIHNYLVNQIFDQTQRIAVPRDSLFCKFNIICLLQMF